MKYTAGILLLVALLTGCYGENDGRVAIVDLDEIASATGRDKDITQRVQLFVKDEELKLTALRDELRITIEQEEKTLGEKPSTEQQEKLNQLSKNSEAKLRQEIAKVEEMAAQLRINLVLEFKKQVEPVARRVATNRGISVIMIKQNAMLYIAPASDITNDVIDEMQKMDIAAGKAVSNKVVQTDS